MEVEVVTPAELSMVTVRLDKDDELVVEPGNRIAVRLTVLVVLEKMFICKLLMDVLTPMVKRVKSVIAFVTCKMELVALIPSIETPSLIVKPVVIRNVPPRTNIQSPETAAEFAAARVANGTSKRCRKAVESFPYTLSTKSELPTFKMGDPVLPVGPVAP